MKRFVWLCFVLGLALAAAPVHVVRPGETLYRIARNYGVPLEVLAAANGIRNVNLIRAGQKLVIPSEPGWPEAWGLRVDPWPPVQGRPAVFRVPPGVTAVRVFNLQVPAARGVALVPVPADTRPGLHPFALEGAGLKGELLVAAGGYASENIVLSEEKNALLDRERIRAEKARLLEACGPWTPEPLWRGPWRWPLDRVEETSAFGTRRSYNGRPGGWHGGVDLRGQEGTPVYAPAAGVVGLSDQLYVRGNAVVLRHGLGVCSGYYHLSERAVEPGQKVQRGDLLGYVGATGLVTGPHLHWEVRLLGQTTDPAAFIRPRLWAQLAPAAASSR
ncbi:peptidoglycan DD-metalloendopeptidase family protein [Deinococcota bacterium DY0809b]